MRKLFYVFATIITVSFIACSSGPDITHLSGYWLGSDSYTVFHFDGNGKTQSLYYNESARYEVVDDLIIVENDTMIIEELTNDLLVLREPGSEYTDNYERPKEKHFLYGIWGGMAEKGEVEIQIKDDVVIFKVDWNTVFDGPYII